MRRVHAILSMARAQYAIDLSGVRTGTDGEKPLLGARGRSRQVLTEAIHGIWRALRQGC